MQISSIPPYSGLNTNYRKNNTQCYRYVNFTAGIPKSPKRNFSLVQQIYKLCYIPVKETVTTFKDGHVYTETPLNKGTKRLLKKYPIFSKKPSEIIDEDRTTKLAKRTIYKDSLCDVEFIDIHSPQNKFSARYNDLAKGSLPCIYTGDINLRYWDNSKMRECTFNVDNETRKTLLNEFNGSIEKTYRKELDQILNQSIPPEDFDRFYENYHKDPNTIAIAILSSPSSLEDQLGIVPESMPYGIEAIMAKVKNK